MKVTIFVTVWALGLSPANLKKYYLHEPLDMLMGNPKVEIVEYYEPYPGDVPRMDDVPSPTGMIEIEVKSLAAAQALVSSDEFHQLLKEPDELSGNFEKVNLEFFETAHYPIPNHDLPPPRTSPLSFVVRYYGPVTNQAEFVEFYTKNHPPVLAKLPGIQNVLCYLPINYENVGEVPNDAIIIGNEVVFDDLETLVLALDSDAMPAIRADSEQFKSFGYNSHHAMLRTLIFARDNE